MAKPEKKTVTVGTQTYEKLDVVTRRLATGGANQPQGRLVRLIEPGWTVRSCNTEIDGRYWTLMNQLGYVDVRPDEIAGGLPQGDLREQDGKVVSGEHGREVWVKIPTKFFNAIALAKAERLDGTMRSASKLKARTQETLGAEGADGERQADRASALSFEVEAGTERIAIEPRS